MKAILLILVIFASVILAQNFQMCVYTASTTTCTGATSCTQLKNGQCTKISDNPTVSATPTAINSTAIRYQQWTNTDSCSGTASVDTAFTLGSCIAPQTFSQVFPVTFTASAVTMTISWAFILLIIASLI
eukprot:TRINITY_DN827_c1_g1_i1.p1 TRINITY_DN827_c1_g1~~TRINITY_DN827_c1_g1_i1.p1  ORF type:complete len:130 (+),score=31.71 TRINITY_DN827_c1_g1_i1:232-621(+)